MRKRGRTSAFVGFEGRGLELDVIEVRIRGQCWDVDVWSCI